MLAPSNFDIFLGVRDGEIGAHGGDWYLVVFGGIRWLSNDRFSSDRGLGLVVERV